MKNKLHIFLIFCLCIYHSSSLCAQWTQFGADIDGKTDGDKLGSSVAYSSDGTKVAVGIPNSAGGGNRRGQVRVYQNTNGTWAQLGNDINGETDFDQSGWSVALSSDGTKLAMSSIYNQDNSGRGHVRIFQLKDSVWTRLGEAIEGEKDGDNSGFAISLSSDGRRVAIGAPNNAGEGLLRGHVRVYQYDNQSWVQLGDDINGEADSDNSGSTVSLSADGTKLAIGAKNNNGGGLQRGHVRVYQFNINAWSQLGEDIDGEADEDNVGASVSLSFDGSKLAIGATGNDDGGYNSGQVRVFQFNSKTWTPFGATIHGDERNSQSGGSVCLSADGTKLAIGARLSSGGGYHRGTTRVFQYKEVSWSQLGNVLNGEADSDLSGHAVFLSADGGNLVVGAPANGGEGGQERGHVRIYQTNMAPSVLAFPDVVKIEKEAPPTFPTLQTDANKIETKLENKAEEKVYIASKSVTTTAENSNNEKTLVSQPSAIASIDSTQNKVFASPTSVETTAITPNFKIYTEGGKNKLTWTTKIETTTKGFYIDRQKDDDWESLGYISAYFNVNTYQFEDNYPPESVNTYRVRTAYKTGDMNYSNTVSVDNNWKLRDIKLFPNQSKNTITIDNGGQVINSIIVTNTMGQILISKIKTGEPNEERGLQSIDVQGLVNGVYLVHIMSGKKIMTQKFLKE